MEEENTIQNEVQELEQQQVDVVGEDLSSAESAEAAAEQQEESPQQVNFRRLREQKENAERALAETQQRLAAYEQQQTAQQEADEDEFGLGDDDLAEGKHFKKVHRKVKNLEQQLSKYEAISIENRLRAQYADFDAVVSKENIDSLASQYPEVARTLDSTGDLYTKAVSAYTMIKNLGIVPSNTYDSDKLRVQENQAKPRPLSSVSPQKGNTPLTKANAFANGLTPELKRQLHKEMVEAAGG